MIFGDDLIYYTINFYLTY